MKQKVWVVVLITMLSFVIAPMTGLTAEYVSNPTFTVTVPADYDGPLSGRCLIVLTRDGSSQPYTQLDVMGVPVFGKTVYNIEPGKTIQFSVKDADVTTYPIGMGEIPVEELYVQAFFIKYTEFKRTDGYTVWGMADLGGGGNFKLNPRNLYSDVQRVDFGKTKDVKLTLSNAIPMPQLRKGEVAQQGVYEDTHMVRYLKIQSAILTQWWGADMYLGANVLLPKGYDPKKKYPVLYYQGNWPGGNAPLGYGGTSDAAKAFTNWWNGADRGVIIVTFRDATMFYDTSYSVNSANSGPYGDAIVKELIPHIEERFSTYGEGWSRMLAGSSAGGWEALAMQIFYPDFFGGAWALCPDSVDFNHYQIVNIYKDTNAFYMNYGWTSTERPASRFTDGNVRYTMREENAYEAAIGGGEAASLGQWGAWDATYSPVDKNGLPMRVFNPITGVINREVAEYWREHYDLNAILQRDWKTLGPKLVGKIHIRGGDMDNYYFNLAQYRMSEFLESTANPFYDGYSITFPRKGHTGNITNQELITEMIEHMKRYGKLEK